MQELEKILEEIDETIERYGKNPYIDGKVTDLCYGMNIAKDIIRKHMNDGWIPVEERLPEVFGKYWATIRYDDGRISDPVVADFRGVKQKYVVDTPNGREYETWGIDSAFYGGRVIAWRPCICRTSGHDRDCVCCGDRMVSCRAIDRTNNCAGSGAPGDQHGRGPG